MKQKLEKLRDELKALLLKVHELITEQEEEQQVQKARPIDPPPPDKPKHP